MRIFDPHIHMTSRTTDDYEAMSAAGVRALERRSHYPVKDGVVAVGEIGYDSMTPEEDDAFARLAVEPEPGCVPDTVADAVAWPAGRVDHEYVGICLDTCHLAVSFADPVATVAAIRAAGLSIVTGVSA